MLETLIFQCYLICFIVFLLFFFVTFNSFFIIDVVKENTKVKLALAIPAGIDITLVKGIILIPPDVADKASQFLSI